MEATITKDWETLSSFVYNRVSGKDTSRLTENDYDVLNKEVSRMVKDFVIEERADEVKKIMSLNILDKKVSFDIFDKVPPLWYAYYGTAMITVAEEQHAATVEG